MPCYRPIQVHEGGVKENGKKIIVFNSKDKSIDGFKIPCGKCIGCMLSRAREWSIRCKHETQMHDQSAFITLTFNNEHLPKDGSLDVTTFQKFMKRLRKQTKKKIRFFHCGEYGKKLARPHYHALIFGHNFPDRILWKEKPNRLYTSKELEGLWPYGFSTIGNVEEASAGYVARYTLKKVFGAEAKEHYGDKKPEYVTMSRKPGIGNEWYKKFKKDIYPSGVYIQNGAKTSPPKYYDRLYGLEEPEKLEEIKLDRQNRHRQNLVTDVINGKLVKVSNNDSFRLPVRERVKLSQIKNLKRSLEEES
jgi:hypothetical protein